MGNRERDEPPLNSSSGLSASLGLPEALPLLFSAARSGRLWAEDGAAGLLEVWLELGQVVHAEWGPLRGLTALEMAALLPPTGDLNFEDGRRAPARTLDLSGIAVAARLADVSRSGAGPAAAIPGIDAIPRRTDHRPRTLDHEAARLLEQIDGVRSVADVTTGRQPLAVVRALAALVEQGAVSFAPETADVAVEPEPPAPPEREPAPVTEVAPGVRGIGAARRRFHVNFALATVALALAVGLWVAIQRTQTGTSGVTIAITPEVPPNATALGVAAAPTSAPTPNSPPATGATLAGAQPTQPPATSPAVPAPGLPAQAPLLDETFASGPDGWPSAAASSAFWDPTGYHLAPRNAGQYVAVTAPNAPPLTDGAVAATFKKLSSPAGGGYGVILRAQDRLDGSTQGGRYYVFEVGDDGRVGAWRREQDQWIPLEDWVPSEAVHTGEAENSLLVRAVSSHFTFAVNGATVAELDDPTLSSGAVGAFAGGDGNQVLLEHFTVMP